MLKILNKWIDINESLNEHIYYCCSCWENLIDNSYYEEGFDLFNPYLLLNEIQTELEYDNLNKYKQEFFSRKINKLINNNLLIEENYKQEFNRLLMHINSSNNTCINSQIKHILTLLNKNSFFNETLTVLNEILLKNEIHDEEYSIINMTTDSLISMLYMKGYTLSFLKELIASLFIIYSKDELDNMNYPINGLKHFPFNIDYKSINKDDQSDFILKLYAELELKDRIMKLNDFFIINKNTADVFFSLQGIYIDETIQFGEITLYNNDINELSKRKLDSTFTDQESTIRAKITTSTIGVYGSYDFDAIFNSAEKILASHLNLLKFFNENKYISTKSQKYFLEKEIIIGDIQYNTCSNPYRPSIDKEIFTKNVYGSKYFNGISELGNTLFNSDNKLTSKLINSLTYFNNALNYDTNEEKILNYWIVFESLINMSKDKLKELNYDKDFSKLETVIFFTKAFSIYHIIDNEIDFIYWDLSNKYNATGYRITYGASKKLELDDEIAKLLFIHSSSKKSFSKLTFIENLMNIDLNDISCDPITRQNIEKAKLVFSDSEILNEYINDSLKTIENDLTLIYIYRNRIVHNAHISNNILDYHTTRAEYLCSIILNNILNKFSESDNIEELLSDGFLVWENIKEDIKNGCNLQGIINKHYIDS